MSTDSGKPWTVLVFMVPSDDLEGFALDDIAEMQQVYPADQFTLAVQMHRPAGSDRFTMVGGQVRFEDDPPIDTIRGSLVSFLDWGFRTYPSTYKMVVLWGHSYGVGLNLFSPRQDQRGLVSSTGVRTMVPRPSLQSLFNGNGHHTNGNGNSLPIASLAQALESITKTRGPIDLLGMDSCYMSGVETAYQLKDAARYLIASESWIRKQGWNYANAFGALARQPGIEPEVLGRQIVDGTDGEATRNITLLNLKDIEKLVEQGHDCVQHLVDRVSDDEEARRALQLSLAQARFLRVRQFLDLRDLVSRVGTTFGDADGHFKAFDKIAQRVITARKTTGEGLGALQGLSIYYPFVDARISLGATADSGEVNAVVDFDEYQQLGFVRATRWDDLLRVLAPQGTLPALPAMPTANGSGAPATGGYEKE